MGCKPTKIRLDELLVQKELCASREQARRVIMAGEVTVAGYPFLLKPSTRVRGDAMIQVIQPPRYVGRGGEKLEKALQVFHLDPTGMVFADIGASTGGFTDCLLQHGAQKVYAIDVGTGQLHERLRHDPRVVVIEQCNARFLKGSNLGEMVDGLTIDVSFISLCLLFPPLHDLLRERGPLIALIKPQFEAGRELVGKGGIVKKKETHEKVLKGVLTAAQEAGFSFRYLTCSPIQGREGNIEFLGDWIKKADFFDKNRIEVIIKEVVESAHETFMRS